MRDSIGRHLARSDHSRRYFPHHGLPHHRRRRLHRLPSRGLAARPRRSVIALDNLSTGRIDNVAHLLEHPDCRVRAGVDPRRRPGRELVATATTWSSTSPRRSGVKLIVEQPLESLITNIRGTEIVLEPAPSRPQGARRLDVGDLRQERLGPLHEDADRILGSPVQGALVLQHGEGGRRDPRLHLLPRARHCRRSSCGCSTPSGPGRPAVRHGHPALRAPGARGRAHHGLRRRRADAAASATSLDTVARAARAARRTRAPSARCSTSARRTRSRSTSSPSASSS